MGIRPHSFSCNSRSRFEDYYFETTSYEVCRVFEPRGADAISRFDGARESPFEHSVEAAARGSPPRRAAAPSARHRSCAGPAVLPLLGVVSTPRQTPPRQCARARRRSPQAPVGPRSCRGRGSHWGGTANREAIAAFREKRKPDFTRPPPEDSQPAARGSTSPVPSLLRFYSRVRREAGDPTRTGR
jgi:hypothetical protein